MTWHVPEDDAISTVATARSVGGGSLILADGSNFGVTGWPKLVVIRRGVSPADTLITVLEFSGRSGNTLSGVTTSVGYGDATIQVGDTAFLGPTKCHIVELQDAIDSLSGTVTTVSVVSANGVSGSVATATTTPAITLALGAITPTSVVATGNVSGANLSGTNTGDQIVTLTGDIAGMGIGSFATTIGANKVTNAMLAGSIAASKLVGSDITITESQVASLTTDLAAKAPLASPALTGTPTYAGSSSGTTGLKASATASGTLTLPAGTDTLATQTYVTSQGYLTSNQTITLTGDITGSGTGSFATTIGSTKVTNAMLVGSITAAKLVGSDITITESQVTSLTADLSSKAPLASPALTGTPTFSGSTSGTTGLKASATASGTLTLPAATDTLATQTYVTSQGYLTINQTITLTGDVSGSGTGSFATTIGAGKVTNAMLAGSITAANLVGSDITIAESQVTSLTTDLAAKAPLASPALTGTPTFAGSTSGTTILKASAIASGTLTLPASTDTLATQTYVTSQGYITGNQTIALTGDVTGTGTGSFATTIGATKVTNAMLAGSIAASKLVGSDITITESQVTSLTTDLAAKAPLASPTFTGKATIPAHVAVITTDTDGSTVTFDCNVSDWHVVTLGGNRTLAISNASVGQPITIKLIQAASGGPYSPTWFSGITWFTSTFIAPTMPTGASKAMVVTFKCTGVGTYDGFLAGTSGS